MSAITIGTWIYIILGLLAFLLLIGGIVAAVFVTVVAIKVLGRSERRDKTALRE